MVYRKDRPDFPIARVSALIVRAMSRRTPDNTLSTEAFDRWQAARAHEYEVRDAIDQVVDASRKLLDTKRGRSSAISIRSNMGVSGLGL